MPKPSPNTNQALGRGVPRVDPETPTWVVDPIDGTQNPLAPTRTLPQPYPNANPALPQPQPCPRRPRPGTQNFVHALPLSCVSIGLCVGGAPTLGVVYDPYRDELEP